MILGGLWHGAGWTFVVWSSLHGVYLTINSGGAPVPAMTLQHEQVTVPAHDRRIIALLSRLAAHGLTLLCLVCAWVVFRAADMSAAMAQLASMAGLNGIALSEQLAGVLQHMPWLVSSANISYGQLFANEHATLCTS